MPVRPVRTLRFSMLALLALLMIGLSLAAQATVPPMVNGQPMQSLAPMLKHVTPAVVNISSKTHVRVRNPFFDDPIFRHFFGGGASRERIEQSLGSGVIIDAAKGYILTNNHVVNGADSIKVTLADGRSFQATLVGADPDTDIAVLKISAKHLTQLPLADSTKVQVGDFVVAVGNPFGLSQSVTYGIISALGRTGLGDTYQNFIQTDAAINAGNSGGALINARGELVGINTAMLGRRSGAEGIGFAIPVGTAEQVMNQIIKHGRVIRGWIGADYRGIASNAEQDMATAAPGVMLVNVYPHSPAARAGLQPGDILKQLDGQPIPSPTWLLAREADMPPGSVITLQGTRQGQPFKLQLTLAERPRPAASDGQGQP